MSRCVILSVHGHAKAELAVLKMASILKADAPTEFIAGFEKGLSRLLTKEYDSTAEKAVKSAMKAYKGNQTEAQAKAIESALDRSFKDFGKDVSSEIGSMIEVFYKKQVSDFIDEHGLVVQKASRSGPGIEVDFSLQDEDAIEATERITVQSAGRYFPDQLSAKTSSVIRQIVLESGLPIEEAAEKLEQEIRGALGIDFDAAIPSQFRSNPAAYFDIVANNASVQATNVGRMIAMADAGVEKFRVVAIIDRRTSAICRNLDGKEFAVSNGMSAVEGFLGVQSLEDLENIMGFSKNDSVPKWAGEGMGFPPYHHSCRSTVVPVF